jgi:hypothetical protein
MNTKHTKVIVKELGDSVIDLTRCFTIWFEIVNAEKKAERESMVNDHADFFISTTESLLTSFCIITYRLYDKRNDVSSICKVLKLMEKVNPNLKSELEIEINSHSEVIEKIRRLRHKVFAHRDLAVSPVLIFKAVQLSPDQMKNLVALSQNIVGQLLELTGFDTCDNFISESKLREESSRDDITRIFKSLIN